MRKEPAVDIFVQIKKNSGLFENALSNGDRETADKYARDIATLYRRLGIKFPLRGLEYIRNAKEWEQKIEDTDSPLFTEGLNPVSQDVIPVMKSKSLSSQQPHTVFISYSSLDRDIALSVCSYLESNGILCWIAPRDIIPGTTFPSAIIRAIDQSSLIVLIYSKNSNKSLHVFRELEATMEKDIPILPFRIDEQPLSDDMRYFINIHHWLDAFKNPSENYFEELLESVRTLLSSCSKKQDNSGGT